LKHNWGWSDPRNTKEYENCDICANDVFRKSWHDSGVARRAFDAPPSMGPQAVQNSDLGNDSNDQEALIRAITDRVVAELAK